MLYFFFGQALEIAAISSRFQVTEIADTRLNGLEIGQHATQPALVDIEHAAAFRLFSDGFLGLFLRANEQDSATISGQLLYKPVSLIEARHRLLEIDDMDAVAIHKDERLHLGVPAPGLMTKVDRKSTRLNSSHVKI